MTEPTQSRVHEAESHRVALDLPQEPMVPQTEAERAAHEPLFNKRKMVFWAILTLAVYFTVSVVIPAAFHSAKEAISETLTEASRPGANPEVRTIILPNGKRIIITKTGHDVTISSKQPGEAATAPVPAKPPEPAKPPTPAPSAKK
jgi:hypothetical protein